MVLAPAPVPVLLQISWLWKIPHMYVRLHVMPSIINYLINNLVTGADTEHDSGADGDASSGEDNSDDDDEPSGDAQNLGVRLRCFSYQAHAVCHSAA